MRDELSIDPRIMELINELGDLVVNYCRTGSSYICNPPVTDTDIDLLLLLKTNSTAEMESLGYCIEDGSEYGDQDFISLRKENLNLIVTTNIKFFRRFVLATEVAKELNLLEKTDRRTLFQAFLYKAPDLEAQNQQRNN